MRTSITGTRGTGAPWPLWAAAVLAVLAGAAVLAQTPALRLVSTVWPPFTDETGKARFALDLVEAAFGRMNVSGTTTFVAPSDFTTSLLTGPFDGSAAAWHDAARERVLVYSQPYLENRLVLVGRKGSDVSAAKLPALTGKRIALVAGYSYGDAVELSGPAFVRSQTEEDSLSLLLRGDVEYTLMDAIVVEYILKHHPAEAQARLQVGTTALVRRPLHLAIRRTVPGAESIVSRFDDALRALIADRTYHRLLQVDWIEADVDGDGRTELVPRSDQAGAVPPLRAYRLITPEDAPRYVQVSPRFYVGGRVFDSWAQIPDHYKVSSSDQPPASRTTGSVFTFVWR